MILLSRWLLAMTQRFLSLKHFSNLVQSVLLLFSGQHKGLLSYLTKLLVNSSGYLIGSIASAVAVLNFILLNILSHVIDIVINIWFLRMCYVFLPGLSRLRIIWTGTPTAFSLLMLGVATSCWVSLLLAIRGRATVVVFINCLRLTLNYWARILLLLII